MGLCHAAVQRAIPEALGLAPLWPGTERLIPALEPAPCLDLVAMFADDGVIAGRAPEVLRVAHHLTRHMPALGLAFGKADLVPAVPFSGVCSPAMAAAAGRTLVANGNF